MGLKNRRPFWSTVFVSGWADLNRRPPRPKRGALPTALHPEQREYNPNLGSTSMYKSKLILTCGIFGRKLGIYLHFGILLIGCVLPAACVPLTRPEPTLKVSPPTPAPSVSPTLQVAASPEVTPTPTVTVCSSASIQADTIETKLLDKPMDYYVILPPCYAESSDRRYPTLYLLHGQNFDEDQWLRLGVADTAEKLMQAGEIIPFVIVLPFDHSYKQPREYRFEEVFLDLLIPHIDQNYRTIPLRESRAIGGLSRGGAWAIYLASRHPDMFGIVGAHSPVVFYSNTSALPVRLRDILPEQKPVFYVDAGNNDVDFRSVQNFTELLNELNFSHEWHYNIGFHDETYWSSHVEEYLRWYASQFAP